MTTFEPFDTQMLVEFDSPFPITTVDSWNQDDAAMEDESHLGQYNGSFPIEQDDSISVEIDMDSYEGIDNPEYEMEDGEQNEEELVDIEVYDASPTGHLLPATDNQVEHLELPTAHPVQETAVQPLELSIPEETHHGVTAEPGQYQESTADPDTTVILPTTQLPPPHSAENAVSSILSVEHAQEADTTTQDTLDVLNQSFEAQTEVYHDESTIPFAVTASNVTEVGSEEVTEAPETAGTALVNRTDEALYPSITDELSANLPAESAAPVSPEFVPDENDAADVSLPYPDAPAKDPHEISDGVFIDPPPGVLVSVFSSQNPDYSLFNPPSATAAGSSTAAFSDQLPPLSLLLQSKPTLYYEPLENVFHALREDSLVKSNSDLAEGELVMDFYDLQLVVSEDNIYSREVTLHDMNIVHDGLDMTGPLRLRLQSNLPRFISHYHFLRDQVFRQHDTELEDPQVSEDIGGNETSREEHEEQPPGDEIYQEENQVFDTSQESFQEEPDNVFSNKENEESASVSEGQSHQQPEETDVRPSGDEEQLDNDPLAAPEAPNTVGPETFATSLESAPSQSEQLNKELATPLDAVAHEVTAVGEASDVHTEYEDHVEAAAEEDDETDAVATPQGVEQLAFEEFEEIDEPVENPDDAVDDVVPTLAAQEGIETSGEISQTSLEQAPLDDVTGVNEALDPQQLLEASSTADRTPDPTAASTLELDTFDEDADGDWDEDFDPEQDPGLAWNADSRSISESSVTLSTQSSKSSLKRTVDDALGADDLDDFNAEPSHYGSPGSKRVRTE